MSAKWTPSAWRRTFGLMELVVTEVRSIPSFGWEVWQGGACLGFAYAETRREAFAAAFAFAKAAQS